MSERTILIIGASLLQIPVIQAAKDLRLKTIVADMNPNAPGMAMADETFVMSTKDIEGMVRSAKVYSRTQAIHGVITAGTDASMTVAAVANSLELPGIRFVDAEAATNKIKMRKRLQKFAVPIPKFAPVWNIQDARDALEFLQFPLVMKPADNMGARGVIKVNSQEELQFAFRHAKQFCPTGEMILEEFMQGPEVSVDALAWNGNVQITGIADRIIEQETYFIEVGHNMPSALPKETLQEVEKVMKQGMQALGLTHGAGKGDIKITPDGVKIGEIAGRLSGGFMSSYTYPLSSGVNLIRAAIQISLGESPDDLQESLQRVSVERSLFASPGKLLRVLGCEAAKEIPGVEEIFITKKAGDMIEKPTNNIHKSGHVIIAADSLQAAEEIFTKVKDLIRFESDDIYSVDEKSIAKQARKRFGKSVCWVCKICDGKDCASGVPGMGGVGKMKTFQDNTNALSEYSIVPSYIREHVSPTVTADFLQQSLSFPVMAAPMTGAVTNMKGAIDEYEYASTVLTACKEVGSIAWLGDGASPEKYLIMLKALQTVQGHGILICKPRADLGMLQERFREAERVGAVAVGMDIDAVRFKTMELKKQSSITRTMPDLAKVRSLTKLPFILKGIMSTGDAELAVETGADCVVVSNHGGRVLDDMPGTARVLPAIAERLQGKVKVLVDGGIRSGTDVFKMLALGAEATLVGRPLSIAAVGGGVAGVKYFLNQYKQELLASMGVTGAETIANIKPEMLFSRKS